MNLKQQGTNWIFVTQDKEKDVNKVEISRVLQEEAKLLGLYSCE